MDRINTQVIYRFAFAHVEYTSPVLLNNSTKYHVTVTLGWHDSSHPLNILFTLPLNIVFISSDLIAVSVLVLTL